MSFHVGQLVVCVDDSSIHSDVANLPVKGQVYTVREAIDSWTKGIPHVHLVEVVNAEKDYPAGYGEPWFLARRFRPVDEKRIEVFKRIAADPRVEIDA